jgi:hypothetical protein
MGDSLLDLPNDNKAYLSVEKNTQDIRLLIAANFFTQLFKPCISIILT